MCSAIYNYMYTLKKFVYFFGSNFSALQVTAPLFKYELSNVLTSSVLFLFVNILLCII